MATVLSPYENRVALVRGVLADQTALSDAAAQDLSVAILQVLDRIPERIR